MSDIELSDYHKNLAASFLGDGLSKSTKRARKISVAVADPYFAAPTAEETAARKDYLAGKSPLEKSILNALNGPGDSIERLAFEVNPSQTGQFAGLWIHKRLGVPDDILKRISIQDSLLAAIANTRSSQVSAFGRAQPDRFSTGLRLEPEPHYTDGLSAEEKEKLQDRIAKVETLLLTCGETDGWNDQQAMGFSQYLHMSARNAVVLGRIATEIIWVERPEGRKFHSFRPVDAGTIYKAAPYKEAGDSVRENARHLMETLKNKEFEPEKYMAEEYSWIQVIDGAPKQAFTADELVCHNFYPVADIEMLGYPVTPIDTVISDVVMHLNIVSHNKKYFESGRASPGMIVIKSEDADAQVVASVQQQFNASINGVGNAWRMPIFGMGPKDEITWQSIDGSSRDMEFQYLSDTNARVIMSAFQMSPEELPGYAHLSRGTNNQALSESNNEYKLEAHRDVGIRPLLAQFQNFLNQRILPVLAPDLAKFCSIKFVGLDVDTAEKESTRIQQDMQVHMSYDEVREKVEKDPIGKKFGGAYPLNPQAQAIIEKFKTQGEILEEFFGVKGASQDPKLQFVNNPNWFQWQQMMLEQQQLQQQAQQQAQQPQGQPGQGQDPNAQQQGAQTPQQAPQQPQDLTRSIDQLSGLLGKSEDQLPWSKRILLHHQRRLVEKVLEGFDTDSEALAKEIVQVTTAHLPRGKNGKKK